MTFLRDKLQIGLSTARHTARGPAVLCKSITRRPQKDWNLWQTAQIDRNPSKIRPNPSAQATQAPAAQPNMKQALHSNPHRRN
jgi:hypothetical protein